MKKWSCLAVACSLATTQAQEENASEDLAAQSDYGFISHIAGDVTGYFGLENLHQLYDSALQNEEMSDLLDLLDSNDLQYFLGDYGFVLGAEGLPWVEGGLQAYLSYYDVLAEVVSDQEDEVSAAYLADEMNETMVQKVLVDFLRHMKGSELPSIAILMHLEDKQAKEMLSGGLHMISQVLVSGDMPLVDPETGGWNNVGDFHCFTIDGKMKNELPHYTMMISMIEDEFGSLEELGLTKKEFKELYHWVQNLEFTLGFGMNEEEQVMTVFLAPDLEAVPLVLTQEEQSLAEVEQEKWAQLRQDITPLQIRSDWYASEAVNDLIVKWCTDSVDASSSSVIDLYSSMLDMEVNEAFMQEYVEAYAEIYERVEVTGASLTSLYWHSREFVMDGYTGMAYLDQDYAAPIAWSDLFATDAAVVGAGATDLASMEIVARLYTSMFRGLFSADMHEGDEDAQAWESIAIIADLVESMALKSKLGLGEQTGFVLELNEMPADFCEHESCPINVTLDSGCVEMALFAELVDSAAFDGSWGEFQQAYQELVELWEDDSELDVCPSWLLEEQEHASLSPLWRVAMLNEEEEVGSVFFSHASEMLWSGNSLEQLELLYPMLTEAIRSEAEYADLTGYYFKADLGQIVEMLESQCTDFQDAEDEMTAFCQSLDLLTLWYREDDGLRQTLRVRFK